MKKNPDVDTSFLPDKQREEKEIRVREELRQACRWEPYDPTKKYEKYSISDRKKINTFFSFLINI